MATKVAPGTFLPMTQLGKFADIVMGQSPPGDQVNANGSGLPFLQGNADFGIRHPEPRYWCSASGRIAASGDILISVRAPVGEMNRADQSYIIGRGLAAVRAPEEDMEFIWQSLQLNIHQLNRLSQGSTFEAINKEDLGSIRFVLLPEVARRKAAIVLHAIDETISSTRSVIEQNRQLRTALIQSLLANGLPNKHKKFRSHGIVGRVPQDWQVKAIAEVARVIDCKHRTPVYCESGFAVIRPSDVKEGILDLSRSPRTSRGEYEDLVEHYRPKRGDIVYSRNASFGVAAYADTDEPFTIGQDVVIITSAEHNNLFLFYLLNSSKFKQQLNRLSAGSTFQRINLDQIRRLVVVLPPREEQDMIADVFNGVDETHGSYISTLEQLNATKVVLSEGLLTGRIPIK